MGASAIQLQYNREQLSSVSCNIKCQNTAVTTGADSRTENDSGVFPLEGKKLRRIHTPGPHWSCVLFNFYKSSSARQEKTRPVAKLSTTLQPYFRSHLNATCAVCVRTYMGEELRKKTNKLEFILGAFYASPYLQMFLETYRQYLSHFCRLFCLKNPRERKGEGDRRRNRGGLVLYVR